MTLYTTTADFQGHLRALLERQPKPFDALMVARQVLDDIRSEMTPGAAEIVAAVAAAHNITVEALTGRSHEHKIIWPRHHAAWELRRRRPDMPLIKIAAWLNRLDHSTVVNGLKRFNQAVAAGRYAGERALVERAIPC
jgi:chromosomal replication initiation ATPase DnaA